MKKRKSCFRKQTNKAGCLPVCLVLCLILPAALPLAGCGNNSGEIPVESVELHEPAAVAATTATENAARRNLYDATLYECHVSPYAEEYSFDSSQQFDTYRALPGDTVKKGDVLVSAVETDLLDQIEDARETLQDLTEAYEKYRQETEEDLREQRENLSYLESILENLEKQKPETQGSGENGAPTPNPALASWQAEYDKWKGDYDLQDFFITKTERELQQQKELYDLDYQYYNGQLTKLQKERKSCVVTSQMDGTVVGIRSFTSGNKIAAGDPVIAVGDCERKNLVCSYIPLRTLTKAADVYAFINGKRFEVEAQESDDTARTVFRILDENHQVPMGAYAILVILNDYRNQVVTVPAHSVQRENGIDYVYVMENGLAVSREIKKGMSDGTFVEILSGLEEGESVVVSAENTPYEVPVILERGSIGIDYDTSGEAYLPIKIPVTSPIEYGTAFMFGHTVKLNQKVRKGDAVTKVQVESDALELTRMETRLQRDRERLNDLVAKNREEDQETIRQMQESIREQEEELEKRTLSYNTTKILSPIDGYIEFLSPVSEGEILNFKKVVATVADESIFYIALTNHNENIPAFGESMEMQYPNHDYDLLTAQCRAVTLLPGDLSDSFGDLILLKPDEEATENLEITNEGLQYFAQISKSTVTLKGIKKSMDDVVLLPVDALCEMGPDNVGYVWVIGEDGSPILTPVLLNPQSRQRNSDYYCVIDGLTEGMEVLCWE